MKSQYWQLTHKGDVRCRMLADRHYTRQTVDHRSFCRPGYNMVLYHSDEKGAAVWVWWRPKWEDGRPGTKRKDGLEAIECSLFRNESAARSSDLIREAVEWLPTWNRYTAPRDGLISAVGVDATKRRRSKKSPPGACYLAAGWVVFEHPHPRKGRVWLRATEAPSPTDTAHD